MAHDANKQRSHIADRKDDLPVAERRRNENLSKIALVMIRTAGEVMPFGPLPNQIQGAISSYKTSYSFAYMFVSH
jgi:hypothetical protein